jgi:hypothetical protein
MLCPGFEGIPCGIGIAGCVAYYGLTSDPQALELALKAFQWLDKFGRDLSMAAISPCTSGTAR